MSHPQSAAPSAEIELPFGKRFGLTINSENYPNGASLVLNNDKGLPIVRYSVGSPANPILEQIVAISASISGLLQFVFTLDSPTPAQIAEGYIAGKYTFTFAPPGARVTSFFGTLKNPHPPRGTGEEDNWVATGGGSDDEETSEC